MKTLLAYCPLFACAAIQAAPLSDTSNHPATLAPPPLEETVVVASKIPLALRQVGASVSVVNEDEIELRGYTSLGELLRTQPSVGLTNSGGAGKVTALRIRGEESFRTLMLIDGVDVSDPASPQAGPLVEHLNVTSAVERVEILRGPQGFIYGADAGGVVNIVTRTPKDGLTGEARLRFGRHDDTLADAFVGFGSAAGDAFLSLSEFSTDGFNARASDESGEADGYQNTTAHAKLGLNANEQWRLQWVGRDVQAESAFDGCGFPSTNDCTGEFDQQIHRLSAQYQAERVGHSVAYARTHSDRQDYADGASSYGVEASIDKVEYLGNWALGAHHRILAGGEWRRDQVDEASGGTLERDQRALLGEWQSQWQQQWYATAGVRYDDSDDFGEHLSGRVSLAWVKALSRDWSLKLRSSWGNGFRAPSLSEIAYNNSDSAFGDAAENQLREETSAGYDLGAELYHSSGGFVQLIAFDQTIDQQIAFDLVDFSGYLQSAGESESRGVELVFEVPLLGFMDVLGNYTYNETYSVDNVSRLRRPQHLANLGLHWHFWDESLQLLANLRASADAVDQAFGEPRGMLEDYEVLDLSAQYQLNPYWAVHLRLDNALDDQYQEIPDYNTAGRSFYAGTRLRF